MEKWKFVTIAVLLLGLLGFGIAQQNADKQRLAGPNPVASSTPIASPYLGKTLPPWNFKNWSSQPVTLSSLEGKPAFVEIFRTGCSHCEEAAPLMIAIQNRYAPRGLKIVSIQSPGDLRDTANPENKWADVQSWLKRRGINYPVAFDADSKYFQGTIQKQILGGDGSQLLYPTMLLLDKTGKIDFAQTGHDTAKAIALAVELEKRFPTGQSIQENAADLVKWLRQYLPEVKVEPAMVKAITDDVAQRLQQ